MKTNPEELRKDLEALYDELVVYESEAEEYQSRLHFAYAREDLRTILDW